MKTKTSNSKEVFNVKPISTTTRNLMRMGIMVLAILFSSCGKDGEDGVDGINGIDGTVGAQGPAGQDGNANVSTSDWFNVNWSSSLAQNAYHNESVQITVDDLENSIILVYFKNGDAVYAVPTTWYYTATLNFVAREGSLGLYYRDEVASAPPAGQARFVKIPSTLTGKNAHMDFEKMSYEEVMDHLGLDY